MLSRSKSTGPSRRSIGRCVPVGRAATAAVALVLMASCSGDGETTAKPMDETAAAGRDSKADDAQGGSKDVAEPGAATPSAGCDSGPHPAVKAAKTTMEVAGEERYYLLTVPDGTDEAPAPVVFDFHGLMEGAELAAKASRLPELGTEEGFITVVPNGRGNPISWDIAPDPAANPDMAFVGDMLDTIGAEQCIDTSRVYATGLSNGAMMTSAIACAYPDRFAAVAPVAGVMATCDSTNRPVPVLAFHGTADPILLFNGGVGNLGGLLSGDADVSNVPEADLQGEGYPQSVDEWAVRNGCEDDVIDDRIEDDVVRRTYDCPKDADVVFDIVEGGGHTWPGSELNAQLGAIMGPTTTNLDASAAMWEFFGRFQLPTD